MRPIESADATRLERFHARLSEASVYRRYHGMHPVLREEELRFFTGADGREHIAWVACDAEGELQGVCRVIGSNDEPGTGEVAIVVADDAQHAGVGHDLLRRVLDEAAAAGFERVEALILASNTGARRLFLSVAEEKGIPWFATVADGELELQLDLRPLRRG